MFIKTYKSFVSPDLFLLVYQNLNNLNNNQSAHLESFLIMTTETAAERSMSMYLKKTHNG